MHFVQYVLLFHMVPLVFTKNISSQKFEIISTTESPSIQQDTVKHLLENQRKMLSLISDNNNRIKLLESQNEQNEKTQEKLLELLQKAAHQIDTMEQKLEVCNKNLNDNVNQRRKILPKNCYEVLSSGQNISAVYTIQSDSFSPSFQVLCDMNTEGGGWIVILKRLDGSQDFFLNWEDYKRGFGTLTKEFWLGLQHLHELTASEDNELLIEITGWDNKKSYAKYDLFRIGSESEGYDIKELKGFSGDAGDSMHYHLNGIFTTKDRDQDTDRNNCAKTSHGAWWYKACYNSQLTGTYIDQASTTNTDYKGIIWSTSHGYRSLKSAKMMIRPRNT